MILNDEKSWVSSKATNLKSNIRHVLESKDGWSPISAVKQPYLGAVWSFASPRAIKSVRAMRLQVEQPHLEFLMVAQWCELLSQRIPGAWAALKQGAWAESSIEQQIQKREAPAKTANHTRSHSTKCRLCSKGKHWANAEHLEYMNPHTLWFQGTKYVNLIFCIAPTKGGVPVRYRGAAKFPFQQR